MAVLNTFLLDVYRGLYLRAIGGLAERDDFRFSYFVLNDLQVLAAVFPGLSACHRKALLCRLQQWQDIFGYSMGLFLSRQSGRIFSESPQFSCQRYDPRTQSVVVADSRETFVLRACVHWTGAPGHADAGAKLTLRQQHILNGVMLSLSQHKTVFLLGYAAKQYFNGSLMLFADAISQTVGRRGIFVFVTQRTFGENLQRIQAAVAAGYIVTIVGIQYLPTH